MLEKEHWVGVADRRAQQPDRVVGVRRDDHGEAGTLEITLDALAMVEGAADAAAVGRADDHRHIPIAGGAVPEEGGLVDDLIEGGMDEIRKLHLGDRDEVVERHAQRQTDDRGLGQRRVDHAQLAELLVEPIGGQEDAPLGTDVLAHDDHALVALHLAADRVANRFEQVQFRHRSPPCRAP